MFDIGWSELVVVGVVALIVIGPKELPGVLRNVGKAAGKLRTMAGEFRSQFDDAMREADLHEAKKAFDDAGSAVRDGVSGAMADVKEATSLPELSDTLKSVEAEARSLEVEAVAPPVEIAPEPPVEPEPKPRRGRKKAEDAA